MRCEISSVDAGAVWWYDGSTHSLYLVLCQCHRLCGPCQCRRRRCRSLLERSYASTGRGHTAHRTAGLHTTYVHPSHCYQASTSLPGYQHVLSGCLSLSSFCAATDHQRSNYAPWSTPDMARLCHPGHLYAACSSVIQYALCGDHVLAVTIDIYTLYNKGLPTEHAIIHSLPLLVQLTTLQTRAAHRCRQPRRRCPRRRLR